MKQRRILIGLAGLLLLAGAEADIPKAPKSPKATDALRLDAAAIKKAANIYWLTCEGADKHLAIELNSAANAAHARNDGTEEQACLAAAKDVQERINTEVNSRDKSPAALKPLRCERKEK